MHVLPWCAQIIELESEGESLQEELSGSYKPFFQILTFFSSWHLFHDKVIDYHIATYQYYLAMRRSSARKNASEILPQRPAKYCLSGHQDSVNCVKFHPIYAQVASCGDDCLIKVSRDDGGVGGGKGVIELAR